MTLLECAIALSVLALSLVPLAGVFYSGMSSAAENREYGDAVALGDAALAKADAITYSYLGFYEDQFGSGGQCGGPSTIPSPNSQTSVDLGCHPTGTTGELLTPVDTSLRVGSVQFTLTTYVVWATGAGSCSNAPSPPTCTEAYKQVYAVVGWKHGGQSMTETQSILVYPGGLGRYTGGGQQSPSGDSGSPPSVVLAAPCPPTDPSYPTCPTITSNSVSLTWANPSSTTPSWYEVMTQNSTANPPAGGQNNGPNDQSWDPTGATLLGTAIGTATSFTAASLSPSTTYSFVIVAFSSDGSEWTVSNSEPATTLASADPCQLSSLTVDQSGQANIDKVTIKNGNGGTSGHLMASVSIAVGYQGTCTVSNHVVVSSTAPGLGPLTLTYSSTTNQFVNSPALCPASKFSTGTYAFSVTLDGASQSPSANVSFTSVGGSPQC